MKKWAFDPKKGCERPKKMMMVHFTICNGQKQPGLVLNILWKDLKKFTMAWNHVRKYPKLVGNRSKMVVICPNWSKISPIQ